MSLVFFITGVSSGFGTELALKALEYGHKVIGTVRSRQRASDPVSQIESKGGKCLELDVTHADACFKVWNEAEAIHGHIDVLINNAGLSYLGALEDFTSEEFHAQMDTNVYGPFRLIKASLPSFRKRKTGTIVNVTSIAGMNGTPSCGLYAASKFAMEGLTEALAGEMADHNIRVLLVEPGAFRTNFLGAFKANSKAAIGEYPATKKMLDKFGEMSGKQPGDPVKAAEAMIEVITGQGKAGHLQGKTLRLPLGPDCVSRMSAKIESMQGDLDKTREVAMSTSYKE